MSSDDSETGGEPRQRLAATEGLDDRILDLLAWVLDTETRARIYVYLRTHAPATSEEIAEGTGLYPSTVRESLAALHQEGIVLREKRSAAGAGNNPYEYETIAPSELVADIVDDVQAELNTVFELDAVLGDDARERDRRGDGPVSISVSDDD
ncbi:helix-turn-helix domain-containing protein [Halosegnis longus]|uniref:ArsR family transcriptional regulator n=1 Tax=Halosegnis longus TaxID=2216012 RepID=A0AAJ4UVL9_9EURY|nr:MULTISPECIES: helix-turn-helix domain-containing protein [Halobacteriales]RNJ26152.1 ArsR family transcriptional regulator [Salella cibi]